MLSLFLQKLSVRIDGFARDILQKRLGPQKSYCFSAKVIANVIGLIGRHLNFAVWGRSLAKTML
jgi:hypothetical protein